MENTKHIGGIWALAVALGMGMAVVNSSAVALAAPADSGEGSSSGDSSPSSSSDDSGSTSSDEPSAKTTESATNDSASSDPRPPKPDRAVNGSGDPHAEATTGSSESTATTDLTPSTSTSSAGAVTTPETLDARDADARRSGGVTSRLASGKTSMKTGTKPVAVDAPTADAAARPNRLDATRAVPTGPPSFASTTPSAATTPAAAITAAPTSSSAASAVTAPAPESAVITPTTVDPFSQLLSNVINAVLSPFANSAPTEPVQSPAAWALLGFARREFEPGFSNPSTTVNPQAGQVTNGLVTDSATPSVDVSAATDPDFISSTRNFFGLFSITSAGDPSDNNYVAVVFETPFFTMVLTSGTDPEDNLGFGAASIGVAGQTVFTFISPLATFSAGIPVEDPFAELFIFLIRAGLV